MPVLRRPTSFFVDSHGVRTGRLLVLAVLAALAGGVAMASPNAPQTADGCVETPRVHASISGL